jgi:predicted methyltransferase
VAKYCSGFGQELIGANREHLYRRHYKIHCQRCKQVFSDARQLNNHEMSAERCEVIDAVSPGDITAYQEKQLKSRKHTAKRQTDEEKWADIYRLLFPGEERVPSPCKYDSVECDAGPGR